MAEFKPVKINNDYEKDITPGAMNVNAKTGDMTFVWSNGYLTTNISPRWSRWFKNVAVNNFATTELHRENYIETVGKQVERIRYINGLFYAICTAKDNDQQYKSFILSSKDGATWKLAYGTNDCYIQDICYGGKLYFILGNDYSGGESVVFEGSSLDHMVFGKSMPGRYDVMECNGSYCLASGYDGTYDDTTKLVTWPARLLIEESWDHDLTVATGENENYYSTIAYGNGVFVVTQYDHGTIYTIDGETLAIKQTFALDLYNSIKICGVIFDGEKFAILTEDKDIYLSNDGISWNKIDPSPIQDISLIYAKFYYGDGYYVIQIGSKIYMTMNINDWPLSYLQGTNIGVNASCIANGLFLLGGKGVYNGELGIGFHYTGIPNDSHIKNYIVSKKTDIDLNDIEQYSVVFVVDEHTLYVKGANGTVYTFGGGGEVTISQEPHNRLSKKADGLFADGIGLEDLTEIPGDLPTTQQMQEFNDHLAATYVKMEELSEIDFDSLVARVAALEAKLN